MWTVNFLPLTNDFELSETCGLLSWYLRGCNYARIVSTCINGHFWVFLCLEMTPVCRKQSSVNFHKNPPTPCSKANDILTEMKIYLFQCIENLKTVNLGISDSKTMPSGRKGVLFKVLSRVFCVKTIDRSRSSMIDIYR